MSAPNSLLWRNAVAAASTANLAGTFLAGPTPNTDTITASAPGAFVTDGYTALLDDRILVKNQTAGLQNGLYIVTTVGSASSGVGPIATLTDVAGSGYVSGLYSNIPLIGAGVGPIATLGAVTGGTLYTTGTYTAVPLTGGTGSGAQATVVVAGGAVTTVTITTPGIGYKVGDVLSAAAASIGGTGSGFSVPVATVSGASTGSGATATITVSGTGPINSVGSFTPGASYTNGQFTAVALTGGTGSGAQATIIVQGGSVVVVTITAPGTGYTVGDSLSASLAGGSGFTLSVATVLTGVSGVAIVHAGTGYTVGNVLSANATFLGGSAVGTGFTATVATVVPSSWVLTRSGDATTGSSIPGLAVFVGGGAQVGEVFVQTATPVVMDTTALTFVRLGSL